MLWPAFLPCSREQAATAHAWSWGDSTAFLSDHSLLSSMAFFIFVLHSLFLLTFSLFCLSFNFSLFSFFLSPPQGSNVWNTLLSLRSATCVDLNFAPPTGWDLCPLYLFHEKVRKNCATVLQTKLLELALKPTMSSHSPTIKGRFGLFVSLSFNYIEKV